MKSSANTNQLTSRPSVSLQSFEQDGRSKDGDRGQIQKAASAIISALSKRHNSTVMLAVVEVKVETLVKSPPAGEQRSWFWVLLKDFLSHFTAICIDIGAFLSTENESRGNLLAYIFDYVNGTRSS